MLSLNPVAKSSWEKVLDLCNDLQSMAVTPKCVHDSEDKCSDIQNLSTALFTQVLAAIQENSLVLTNCGPGAQNNRVALVESANEVNGVRRVRSCEEKRKVRGKRLITCAWCKTTESPEWRRGPQFSKLCNACGIKLRRMNLKEKEKQKVSIDSLLN